MLTVALDLPRDLLGALDVPQVELETRLRELIALELFREGRISSGKGAELLRISKLAFVHLLAQHRISYFTESPEELVDEVSTLEQLLNEPILDDGPESNT
jgi:predicted HTH domain antitoxin